MRNHLLLCLVLATAGCVDSADAGDGVHDSFSTDGKTDTGGITEGSPEAVGVLAVVNNNTQDQLESDVGLSSLAARNITDHGPTFESLAELDAVDYVGPIAFRKLLAYAKANGLVTGGTTDPGGPVGHGILLDCNTSTGPDQQVTVIGDGTSLKLRELTSSGAQRDRPLSKAEWASKKLNLREDFGSQTTLTKEDGTWVARSFGGGFNEIADADCWVDKSH